MLSLRSCPEGTLDFDSLNQECIQDGYNNKRYEALNHKMENYKHHIIPSMTYETDASWSLTYENQRACEKKRDLASGC